MVHNMYKSKRQLSDADTLELLKKGDHGTLAVQGDDGYPYATPVNYILVGGQALPPLRPLRVQDRVPPAGSQASLHRHPQHGDHPQQDHCVL